MGERTFNLKTILARVQKVKVVNSGVQAKNNNMNILQNALSEALHVPGDYSEGDGRLQSTVIESCLEKMMSQVENIVESDNEKDCTSIMGLLELCRSYRVQKNQLSFDQMKAVKDLRNQETLMYSKQLDIIKKKFSSNDKISLYESKLSEYIEVKIIDTGG